MPVAWKNKSFIRYRETGKNYCPLELFKLGRSSPRLFRKKIQPWLYHYNYINSNKLGVRKSSMEHTGIKLMTYFGSHPKETQLYTFWKNI